MTQFRPDFLNIPIDLQKEDQWLCHDKEKKPISGATGKRKDWQNNLTDFETAKRYADEHDLGIGFAFNSQTEFFGVDLDGCVDPTSGKIEIWALTIVYLLASYCEISPSGTGLKIICRGNVPDNLKTINFGDVKHGTHRQQAEFKTCFGYFALTGIQHSGLSQYELRQVNPIWIHDRIAIYKRALSYLEATPPAVEGKGGDAVTFSMACSLIHGFDLTSSEAITLVYLWNQRCVPPWTKKELQHKFDEADKREDGNGRPRGYLLDHKDLPVSQNVLDFCKKYSLHNDNNYSPEEYAPFPTHLLPHPLNTFVCEASTSIGCDASFVALPLLSALAAAIGDSRKLFMKNDYRIPSIIWSAVLGYSGTGKTPANIAVMKYPKQRYEAQRTLFLDQLKNYEQQLEIYGADLKHRKSKKLWNDPTNEPPVEPEKPVCPRTTVSDATLEALIALLAENPCGVLAVYDELASYFGMDGRYQAGNDSATYLSIWSASQLTVDRKGSGHLYIPAAYVSITGGIQPGIFLNCFNSKQRESGMMARFLMVQPPRKAELWSDEEISVETDSQMSALFNSLYDLEPRIDNNGNRTSYEFVLSTEAKQLWIEFFNRHRQEQAKKSADVSAAFSKLAEYVLRFCIVFHCVQQVTGHSRDHIIDAATIRSAIALVEYFKHEIQRIYSLVLTDRDQSVQEKLVDYILNKGGAITVRALQNSNSRKYPKAVNAEAVLNDLVAAGLGVWEETESTSKGGRPSMQFRLTT